MNLQDATTYEFPTPVISGYPGSPARKKNYLKEFSDFIVYCKLSSHVQVAFFWKIYAIYNYSTFDSFSPIIHF